jgi:hypothetical protein
MFDPAGGPTSAQANHSCGPTSPPRTVAAWDDPISGEGATSSWSLRHGRSRHKSIPVDNAHHLEPDSPSRLARKPRGRTEARPASTAVQTAQRGGSSWREAGGAARCRRPRAALPQHRPTACCRRSFHASPGSGEIAFARRSSTTVSQSRSATVPGREAAPEQHRGEQPEQAFNHQNDPEPIPPMRLLVHCGSAVRAAIGR